MVEQIVDKVREKYDTLTSSEKKVAEYIMSNPTSIALLTSSRLAKEIEVSESTVIRFATQLGFRGYSDLRRALQDDLREDRTLVKLRDYIEQEGLEQNTFTRIMQMDIENIRLSMKEIDQGSLERALKDILEAKRVYIIGMKGSAAIAAHLEFYLQIILERVISLTNTPSKIEQMAKVKSDDCLIAISFKRYSKETVEAIKYFHDIGAKTIAITDSNSSPLSRYASAILKVHTHSASFVDSYTAAVSLINVIMTYLAKQKKEELTKDLQKIENLYKQESAFY